MDNLDQFQRVYPRNRQEWRVWLEDNHQSARGVWVIYYKKETIKPTISYEEAAEDTLSYGGIDSKVNASDKERYMQVFTLRKKGSRWSRLNKNRVNKIIKQGLINPAGINKVEAAKKDGSWSLLDDVEDLIIPEDLMKAFLEKENALNNYSNFGNSSKKQIYSGSPGPNTLKPGK